MWGSTRFKWARGDFDNVGYLKTTNLALSTADANSTTAKIQKGKLMARDTETEMKYATDTEFQGILTEQISLDGITGSDGYIHNAIWNSPQGREGREIPARRGKAVTLRVPLPFSEAEFEGVGDASIETLVATTNTGAITVGTAAMTELTCNLGSWIVAAAGDWVIAHLIDPTLTPNNTGEVRILVRFVSPYLKSA